MHAQWHEEVRGYLIIVVTYARMLLSFDHSICSMHFPPPILPVMGVAPTLRQQSCVVTNRSERLANVTLCADCYVRVSY